MESPGPRVERGLTAQHWFRLESSLLASLGQQHRPSLWSPITVHLTLVKYYLSQLTPVFYMSILFNVTSNMWIYFF